jgi:hypothetical protein
MYESAYLTVRAKFNVREAVSGLKEFAKVLFLEENEPGGILYLYL